MKNIFTILLVFSSFICFSQGEEISSDLSVDNGSRNEITFFFGMSSYEGDLHCFDDNNLGVTTNSKLSFGLSYQREINENLLASIAYYNIKIEGDDNAFATSSGHPRRGFSFTNTLHEVSLRADYLPFGKKNWKVQPFVFGGVGLAFGGADTDYNRDVDNPVSDALIMDDMENNKSTSFALPIGFGVKAMLSKKVSVGLEMGLRIFANDYLDGVSVSANSEVNDYYGIGGITLGYKI